MFLLSACRVLTQSVAKYVAPILLCKALVLALLLPAAAFADTLRLVAIGDSLTHGYGLAPQDGFVPQLEAWLKGQGRDVQVVNMGVSGDTTEGGRARLGWALADGADAVIVELGGNDMLRGIDPAVSRANLAAMLQELGNLGMPALLTGIEAPLNYGADYKAAFDGMYVELAAKYDAVLYANFLAEIDGAGMMQPDGIHPNADGVAAIVRGIGPKVLDLLDRATP